LLAASLTLFFWNSNAGLRPSTQLNDSWFVYNDSIAKGGLPRVYQTFLSGE